MRDRLLQSSYRMAKFAGATAWSRAHRLEKVVQLLGGYAVILSMLADGA